MNIRSFDTPYPNPHDYGLWRAAPGGPVAEEMQQAQRDVQADLKRFGNRLTARPTVDQAWVVCLRNAGLLDAATARRLLDGIEATCQGDAPGGEDAVIRALGDEDVGSLVGLGRTQQEPMSRLNLRDQMCDYFDWHLRLAETVADVAEAHAETILPAYTHFAQAQPTTFGAYLLSVLDHLLRGLEQLELAYTFVNRNSGGCGSTSGIAWEVDRAQMTRLLGFDALVEPAFDCEASQDHSLAVCFALSNVLLGLCRTSLDLEIWTMREMGFFTLPAAWLGQSSLMPQKAHPGSRMETLRGHVNAVLAQMQHGVLAYKGEPHGDVLTTVSVPGAAFEALARAKAAGRIYAGFLAAMQPRTDRLLDACRRRFACASEVVVHLVRELGYGPRRAHRIVATFVRRAREQDVPACETTGEMLDAAAASIAEQPPHLDTETLRRLLDPRTLIETHVHTGGPAPAETRRIVADRREQIAAARRRQQDRLARRQQGLDALAAAVAALRAEAE